jgi:hypothetical protein
VSRSRYGVLWACLMGALPAACTSGDIPGPTRSLAASGLAHAAATRACGPADGPAVAIYIASAPVESLEPAAPYVRIYVWQPLDRLAERSWNLAGGEPEGSAWFQSSATDFEVAVRGTVRVNRVAPDGTVEGSADVTFPSTGRVRGGFRAVWVPNAMLCG